MDFCVAIFILKMEEIMQHIWSIMLYYFKKGKTTETQKKICVIYGLQSFLVLLTFWPNNSLLGGRLMHWKMFISTPGLYPLEVSNGRYSICKSIKSVMKKKNVCFILWKKYNRHFGQSSNTMAYLKINVICQNWICTQFDR